MNSIHPDLEKKAADSFFTRGFRIKDNPVIALFDGKRITVQSGSSVWGSIGPARAAVSNHFDSISRIFYWNNHNQSMPSYLSGAELRKHFEKNGRLVFEEFYKSERAWARRRGQDKWEFCGDTVNELMDELDRRGIRKEDCVFAMGV